MQPRHVVGDSISSNDRGTASRAALCKDQLAQLNPHVHVATANVPDLSPVSIVPLLQTKTPATTTAPATTAHVTVCVVTIPLPEVTIVALDEACREAGVCFIYAVCMGVFSMVFCDFGNAFQVSDKDGEEAAVSQIESVIIDDASPVVVKVLEDHGRHGLETGDLVQFALAGCAGLGMWQGICSDSDGSIHVCIARGRLVNHDACCCYSYDYSR